MFAFCVEASHARGMGHLYRALALAEALERHGAAAQFLINNWEAGKNVLRSRNRGYICVPLDETGWESQIIRDLSIDVWINDRLDTGSEHAANVRQAGSRLVTFDDRGPGAAEVDINIAALPFRDDEHLAGKVQLRGVQYLVLDPAISGFRRQRHSLESLVVSMGGSDTYGITVDVVQALKVRRLGATVILGPGFDHDAALEQIADGAFNIKRGVASLAEEFSRHDLAITAGGMTPCEANAAGLPCIIVAAEAWEAKTGELLADLGGSLFAGSRQNTDFGVLDRIPPIAQLSQAALAHVPCDGADRVARAIIAL